jgi:hypothetical protein
MKDMVLVPIKFLLFLLMVLVAGTSLQVLVDFSRLAPTIQQGGMQTVSLLIANAFFLWIIPAIGLTWLFSSFSILRNGRFKLMRQVFLMVLVAGSLFSVLYFFPPLEKARSQVSKLDFQVPDRTILSNQDAFFVLYGSRAGGKGAMLLHRTGPDARFTMESGVAKNLDTQELTIPEQGLTISMDSVVGGRQVLFEDPAFMNPVRRWLLDGLSAYQAIAANDLIRSLVLALSTAFLLTSLWLFVRLSQWPLVNSVLSLGILCGVLVLPAVLKLAWVRDLLAFVPPIAQAWLVPGVYGLFSLIFFGCILLLPSRKDWQPGVNQ